MRFLLIICSTFWIYSCSSNETVPKDLLPKEKMVSIYEEIRVLEAVKFLGQSDTSIKVNSNEMYSAIFRKLDVKSEDFIRTHNYYMTKPKVLSDIFEKVEENLHERKARITAESEGATEASDTTLKYDLPIKH